MTFDHLRSLEPVAGCYDDEVVLTGKARDFFVGELWGFPGWGPGSRVKVVGVYPKPGLDTVGLFGHAFGRWWVSQP